MIVRGWQGDRLRNRVLQGMVQGLFRAGPILTDTITHLIGIQGPPRSQPWNPPHIDTAALIKSIDYYVDGASMTLYAGGTVPYLPHLELGTARMAPRPFMTRALIASGDSAAREICKI